MEGEAQEERLNFIPCLAWVKRGVAKTEPDKVKLSEEELAALLKEGNSNAQLSDEDDSDDSNSDEETNESISSKAVKAKSNPPSKITDDLDPEYDFDKYDVEDDKPDVIGGIAGLTVYSSNKEDPYVTLPDDSDNDSEKGDDLIKPNDNLILVGHVVGDQATLEVYVQNEEEGSLYVHHDLLLPDIPLCVEWLNYDPSSPIDSNLCAIGGMSPVIHVMDLDIVDCLEPAYVLGSADIQSNDPVAVHFKRKTKKGKKRDHIGHKDAVLDLSWNTNFTHVLASGSVDQTVILWDLETGTVNTTLDAFREKVQTIKWHPFEGQTLLAGSCDKAVRVFDCRSKDSYKAWAMTGEVERVIWNHYDPFCFIASTDTGTVHYVDCRNDKPVWELSAHSKEVTGLSLSSSCPNLLFTSSSDGLVKVWDIAEQSKPVFVWENDVKLGNLQCLGASPDSPFTIAAGGDKKSRNFGVWDLCDNAAVANRFSKRPLLLPVTVKKEDSNDDKSISTGPTTTVMDTVATAMDDLCLSLSHDSKDKLKKLSGHTKTIKKNKKKKKPSVTK